MALGLVAGLVPTGLYVLKPGPALPLAGAVVVPGGDPAACGRYLMVTVRADRATTLTALAAAFQPSWTVVPRSALIPGGLSVAEYLSRATAQMAESQRNAVQVASANLGRDVGAVSFEVGEVGGPSAGGMFALEIIRQAGGGGPPPGVVVAGSGALLPDGRLAPVGGIAQKVAAAEAAGAAYFVVPREEAVAARSAARRIRVIVADDVREALRSVVTAAEAPR
ncbi:MAG: S16 family serine protease [Bacillota bacterium]